MKVLVLGGAGFIGRHVTAALRGRGHSVVVGTRFPHRVHTPDKCSARFEVLTEADRWYPRLRGIDAVVNAVGILRERPGETYEALHHRAPAALAAACARRGIRFVHVSALGLRAAARSRFITSKLAGEAAIASAAGDYSIVRPSLLDGEGGFGARWFRAMARLPVHFAPADAVGRVAALDVRDLGEAIARLCELRDRDDLREVELGGAASWRIADYLAVLRLRYTRRPALRCNIPATLSLIFAALCDLLHFSPFSLGHLELMRQDNVPRENLLPLLLGREPTRVGGPPGLSPDRGAPPVPSPGDRAS